MSSRLGLLVSCLFILSACAPFKPNDHKAAVCNELNSKIVFNANTSITREANIQRSEAPLLQHSYEKNNCDR